MKRELTPAQIEARDKRRAQFRSICKQVADMGETARLTLAAKMQGLLVTCEGHSLSLHNCCLIALQMPAATILGGFKQWQKQGRAVTKGQHGLMIWVPISGNKKEAPASTPTATTDGTEPDETRFIMATMFDISQTHEIESTPVSGDLTTTIPQPAISNNLVASLA